MSQDSIADTDRPSDTSYPAGPKSQDSGLTSQAEHRLVDAADFQSSGSSEPAWAGLSSSESTQGFVDVQGDRDLIAAVATASGAGAVCVVRLSGDGAGLALNKIFKSQTPPTKKPRTMVLGRLSDPVTGKTIDQALAVYFPGPYSFTGEDSAEIQGHGGSTVPRLILEAVLAAGARLAKPGEFTQRAFLNGRLSLDQAEAVAELVASQSEAEAALAARHLEGALAAGIAPLNERLRAIAVGLTADLDFFEEKWEIVQQRSLIDGLHEVARELDRLVDLRKSGRIFRDGLRVVLAGPPNAGKSSLFNALLGRDRALVNPRPGTTRDYLEAAVSWSGLRVELVDTAGLREDADELESQGQILARRELERADVVIWLSDLSSPVFWEEPPDYLGIDGPQILRVFNKADLASEKPGDGALVVSALTGEGLSKIKQEVLALTGTEGPSPEIVPNLRQQRALESALGFVIAALTALEDGQVPDIAALEIKAALDAMGLITGVVLTEDLLEEVFSQFCLGK
jgi:tRNA modification GTPase